MTNVNPIEFLKNTNKPILYKKRKIREKIPVKNKNKAVELYKNCEDGGIIEYDDYVEIWVNNISSYMDEDKKQIIKEFNYTYRYALEVSAYLIEAERFERFYKEMQIADLQKELAEMDEKE